MPSAKPAVRRTTELGGVIPSAEGLFFDIHFFTTPSEMTHLPLVGWKGKLRRIDVAKRDILFLHGHPKSTSHRDLRQKLSDESPPSRPGD